MDLGAGDLVEHGRHGVGVVLNRVGRTRVRVCFRDAPTLPRTVQARELELESTGTASAPPRAARRPARQSARRRGGARPRVSDHRVARAIDDAAPAPLPLPGLDRSTAWQSLEALRLGVVPTSGTGHYTVGRDAEIAAIRERLTARSGYLCVFGEYGSGKTHLLDIAESLALADGFAVARLTIDPTEKAIQNPARVWGAIAGCVEFRGERGLEALLERLVESDAHATPDGERFSAVLSPCLWAMRSEDRALIEDSLDHVHARDVDLERYRARLRLFGWYGPKAVYLPDYRTMGRVYVHLIGALASWVRDLGGAGLLLLLDEVERVEALSWEDQEWALDFQRHLAAVTLPASAHAFDPAQLYLGGHAHHREFPGRFEEDQPLVSITSMTPLVTTVKRFERVVRGGDHALHLDALQDRHTAELVSRVADVYRAAFPGYAPREGVQQDAVAALLEMRAMGEDSVRRAVRRIVAHLDADRLGAA